MGEVFINMTNRDLRCNITAPCTRGQPEQNERPWLTVKCICPTNINKQHTLEVLNS